MQQASSKACVLQVLNQIEQDLRKRLEEEHDQLEAIRRVRDNIAYHKEPSSIDCESLLRLNDDNRILDSTVLPFKYSGSYYKVVDVYYTRKQYMQLQWLMRIALLCTGIMLLCVLIDRVWGY